ncbi:MAG: phosphate signaling complex protein PhoU [Chloroflexi bacterium]|nr:phosphate signaling complex protein PhoU [Chloroflexota bacterium]
MPRETLDRQIHHLQEEVLLLGSMVEQAMLNSVEALKRRDLDAARQIYEADIQINEKRFAIENAILILIATQQPIARDLRLMAAILEVTTELERMGDYAKGIAKVNLKLGSIPFPISLREITQMAELAVSMLHRALSAFISENSTQACQIPLEDDQVDSLYNQVYHNLVSAMIADPEIIDSANLLMWVAHNLERMADRVTNICERTVFIATGELFELETSNDEEQKK